MTAPKYEIHFIDCPDLCRDQDGYYRCPIHWGKSGHACTCTASADLAALLAVCRAEVKAMRATVTLRDVLLKFEENEK